MKKVVNVSAVIDESKVNAFQVGILILCASCLLMDGFDVQAVGYVAPAIILDWRIPNYELGSVFAAGNFGLLIGSLLFTMLADKIGRRPVLIGGTLGFSIVTVITARVVSTQQLLILRLAAGLMLGSVMPNILALIGEYSSRRLKVRRMMYVQSGFVAGASIGGLISAWLIPAFGWRAVFYVGGVVPIFIAALMYFFLPESLQFLAQRGQQSATITRTLKRIQPEYTAETDTQYITGEKDGRGVAVTSLFRDGRAICTFLLWIINFMNLLDLFFLANWLPTVIREAGYSLPNAVFVGTAFQIAGFVAVFAFAWFIARFALFPVVTVGFLVAFINIALIGPATISLLSVFLVVFVAGLGIQGGQAGANALAANYYPTRMRSTGIGWSLGIGRVGAIVGPYVGGQLLRLQWSSSELFVAAAVPALISCSATLVLWRVMNARTSDGNDNAIRSPEHVSAETPQFGSR